MALKNLGILWGQYGPYHIARVAALKQRAGAVNVHALELANQTADYVWTRSLPFELVTAFSGEVVQQIPFWRVFFRARRIFCELNLDVCILPSYWPKQILAVLLAAKSLGIRTVMMNESHAGTARATGAAAQVKRVLVNAFDAALVGGQPQKRYFASLGLPVEKIFPGYDAVDNQYFADKAATVRADAARWRAQYALPDRYFLSLGRFVAKKNLPTLILAYRQILTRQAGCPVHLVMVGSGEEEGRLKTLCAELHLPVYDKSRVGGEKPTSQAPATTPGVHFYGFRQIDENPLFYALAEAFILPSSREEWGLVVNEAMACGLPVVVSETVGCAEDLLVAGSPSGLAELRIEPPLTMISGLRQNGFVFPPDSSEALAGALNDLSLHPELRELMGQAGRQIVETVSCDVFAMNALRAARAALGEEPENP